MKGKYVGGFIIAAALAAGAGVYWTQEYAYYYTVADTDPAAEIRMVSVVTGQPEPVQIHDFQGIDADSSPKRYRACFTLSNSLAMLTETYELAEDPEPTVGPRWFGCYDAKAIGAALESGEALAFLSQHDIKPGVDRLVAVFPDGRAFAWHQLNDETE